MSILCIGDSLTYGKVGYSYIPYLDTTEDIINKGVNGDSTHHTLTRLRKIVENRRYQQADTYIVSVGTNDVLLPYMTTISKIWNMQMKPKCRMLHCILDAKAFAVEYEAYITLLKEHHKKIILVGLPYIQLERYPHRYLQQYNAIIQKLAKKHHCPFVDIYHIQLRMEPTPRIFSWKYRNMRRRMDSTLMTFIPPMKEWFTKTRRLKLTVDGVHFTKLSAKALADAIHPHL